MLGLYGWLRYLIATDRGEVIWGMVFVVGVAVLTGSPAATAVATVVVAAALVALWRLNRVPRPTAAPSPGGVRPIFVAAAFCAVLGAVFYSLGLFRAGLGSIFVLIAWLAIAVSRPRRS